MDLVLNHFVFELSIGMKCVEIISLINLLSNENS
jgi:hypothetical protein